MATFLSTFLHDGIFRPAVGMEGACPLTTPLTKATSPLHVLLPLPSKTSKRKLPLLSLPSSQESTGLFGFNHDFPKKRKINPICPKILFI